MENAIKLLARHEDLDALLHSPLLQKYATTPPAGHAIVDTYFDTPDRELKSRHVSLRVRKAHDGWRQTLKVGKDTQGAVHGCEKYETPVKNELPAVSLLRKVAGNKNGLASVLQSPDVKQRLTPMFSTRIQRTVFSLQLPHGDLVECAVDVGEIAANGDTVAVCEVGLALKSGEVAYLFDLALELAQEVPLAMGACSKANRGYALVAPSEFVASKAKSVSLKKHKSVEHAFSTIVENCLLQIAGNVAPVAHCHAEGLHQMRVGVRRFRSALDLVDGLIALPQALRTELDWLAGQLGAARDWDVLAHTTLGELTRMHPGQPQIVALTQAVVDENEQSRRLAAAAVASPRCARLILLLTQWRLRSNWRSGATVRTLSRLDAPVLGFARKTLASSHRRLLRRGGKLDGAPPETIHRIRIAAKKTRYASEFFQSLFRAGEVNAFAKHLSRLQDEFGRMNDAAVADRLLSTLQEKQAALGASAGYVRGLLAARTESGRRGAQKSWRRFSGAKRSYWVRHV